MSDSLRPTPGLPIHHQLPEFIQTHVHRVGDAIQPSHPLLSPSPPAPDPSQHQGLFQCVNSAWGGQSIESTLREFGLGFVAQTVKNLPAMQETWVRSLGGKDFLEKGLATHSSILAWRIPWTEEPGGLRSMGSQSPPGLSDKHFHFPPLRARKHSALEGREWSPRRSSPTLRI